MCQTHYETYGKQAQSQSEDLRLSIESQLVNKGSALVRFQYLKWNEYLKLNELERPDPERIDHVKRIFQTEGCSQLPVDHHIPAIIGQHRLNDALEDARRKGRWRADTFPDDSTTINTKNRYPELEFPDGIECLHGLHRIEAGKRCLLPSEQWWIVDLYLEGISYDLKLSLVEAYSNERKPCDGKIYRKIREYQSLPRNVNSKISPSTCISLENRWWARFNKSRAKKVRSLAKRGELTAGFDALSTFPSLFDAGMKVTTLNTVLATKCYEQISNRLKGILEAWVGFLSGVKDGRQRVDKKTVKEMELRAPGVSTDDAQYLRGMIIQGLIFSSFNAQERSIICGNVLEFKDIIPSLSTFFQDIYFLEACVNGIKWLFKVPAGGTLSTVLDHCFLMRGDDQSIQTREEFVRHGFLALIVFAMCEHQNLPKAPVKSNLKTMPRAKADREVLERFAILADNLGFESPEIKKLKGDSDTLLDSPTGDLVPFLVASSSDRSIQQRCGRPHTDTFEEDRKYLSLKNLCEERDDIGEEITSYFVLKSWFIAFFDPPRWKRPVSGMEIPGFPQPKVQHQHSHEEDVVMEDLQQRSFDEQEQERERRELITKEDIDKVQQRLTLYARQANRKLEKDQSSGLYPGEISVPRESKTRSQVSGSRNYTVIRFEEREGNESDMFHPLQGHVGKVMQLELDPYHGDLTSLVAQKVQEFLRSGKRTCDRNMRYIPAEDCYNVAIMKENKNTLFLIPGIEPQGSAHKAKDQGEKMEDAGDHAMENLTSHLIPDETICGKEDKNGQKSKAILRHDSLPDDPNSHIIPHRDSIAREDTDEDLLENEKANSINSRILDSDTVTIFLKRLEGNLKEVLEPAKDLEWTDLPSVEVPAGDPQGSIARRMDMLWRVKSLRPHDMNLRRLDISDCYKVAMNDPDNTLYMMGVPPETREDMAVERTGSLVHPPSMPLEVPSSINPSLWTNAPLTRPPSVPPGMLKWHPDSKPDERFHWHEEQNRARIDSSIQARGETSPECDTQHFYPPTESRFQPPPNVDQLPTSIRNPQPLPPSSIFKLPPSILERPPPPQKKPVESKPLYHRDKILRGPDQKTGDGTEQSKFSSFTDKLSGVQIRRRQGIGQTIIEPGDNYVENTTGAQKDTHMENTNGAQRKIKPLKLSKAYN